MLRSFDAMILGEYTFLIPIGVIIIAIMFTPEARKNLRKSVIQMLTVVLMLLGLFLATRWMAEFGRADIDAVSVILEENQAIKTLRFDANAAHTKKFLSGEKKGIKTGKFKYTVTTNSGMQQQWIVTWECKDGVYTITNIQTN